MTKTIRTAAICSVILLVCMLTTSCSGYLNPKEINTSEYEPVIKELAGKKQLIDSLFLGPNPAMEIREIQLRDFTYNKTLAGIFPKCLELLNAGKMEQIVCFPDNCLFIVLKTHDGIFTMTRECLKFGDINNYCYLTEKDDVEKEISLKTGWKYQRVFQYTGD